MRWRVTILSLILLVCIAESAPAASTSYHISSADPDAEDAIGWFDTGCAATFAQPDRVRARMARSGARRLDAHELAQTWLPNAGTEVWRFVERPNGAHFTLTYDAATYTCVLLVSRVGGTALRQAVKDMLDAWATCCNIASRAFTESDKQVGGLTARYTDWIVQIPGHPYRYAIGLSTIESGTTAWRAIMSFNPTKTPF